MKIRAETGNIENIKTIGNIHETKIYFFKKIYRIDKPLASDKEKKKNPWE